MAEPIHFYVDPEINREVLNGHIQADLDCGATVCLHFHKRDAPCGDDCEKRVPMAEHRNIFD